MVICKVVFKYRDMSNRCIVLFFNLECCFVCRVEVFFYLVNFFISVFVLLIVLLLIMYLLMNELLK